MCADLVFLGSLCVQVRVWDSKEGTSWTLTKVFAEQRGTISQVAVRADDLEAASACEDGTCYVWAIA